MSHQNPNRRTPAAPSPTPTPQISKTKSLTTTTAVHHLTNRLSRLNPNPNPQPPKPHNSNPQKLLSAHLQAKALAKSATFEPKSGKQGKRMVIEERKDNIVPKVKRNEGGNHENRPFCDAQMQLGNFLATNCAKIVSVDMPPFMQIHAVGLARNTKDSLEKFTSKSLALTLKKEFDEAYGPAWHCIVGTSFGSFVTHSVGGFLYFSLDQKMYILLFKTSVERAN